MTDLPLSEDSLLRAREIDKCCDRFETAWKDVGSNNEQVPTLEDFLSGVPLALQVDWLRELIPLELFHRRRLGELPRAEEYLSRFASLDEALVHTLLAEHCPASRHSPQAGVADTLPPSTTHQPFRPLGKLERRDAVELPDYELLGELGRGAMGVVYKARQIGLRRIVALKMICGQNEPEAEQRARFKSEAAAIAQLQHPNIVQIYESGEHEGLPYFAMEFIDGGTLAQKVAGVPQPPRDGARLIETMARAIHQAHLIGIVHRDLKPANVLLSREGVPKITDFGLAKQLAADHAATTSGTLLGTPQYMAPEQAAGNSSHVGPAADIYALGAILYELLTGRPPFQAGSLKELLHNICEREPTSPRLIKQGTPSDLETICLKCLQKAPGSRYATAADLADDLHRYLADEPIKARPVSFVEHAWRWCRRNPKLASLSAVALLLLCAVVFGSSLAASIFRAQSLVLGEQKKKIEGALGRATRAEREMTERLLESLVARAWALRWSGQPGKRFEALTAIREAATIRTSPKLRDEALASLSQADIRIAKRWTAFDDNMRFFCLDPEHQRFARLRNDGSILIQRVSDGAELQQIAKETPSDRPFWIEWAPAGDTLAIYLRDPDQHVYLSLYQLESKRRTPLVTGMDWHGRGWSGDGRSIAFRFGERNARVYDISTGAVKHEIQCNGTPDELALNFDGSYLATGMGHDRCVEIWDLTASRRLRVLKLESPIGNIDMHPHLPRVVAGSTDRLIRQWDYSTGELLHTFRGHESETHEVTYNRQGDLLASNGADGKVRLWNTRTGELLVSSPGEIAYGRYGLTFSRDSRSLGWSRRDRDVIVWEVAPGRESLMLTERGAGIGGRRSASFSAAGNLLAARRDDGVRLWELTTGQELFHFPSHEGIPFLRDEGRRLIVGTGDGIFAYSLEPAPDKPDVLQIGPVQRLLPGEFAGCDLSEDGVTLAAISGENKEIVVANLKWGVIRRLGYSRSADGISLSPDGRWVATGGWWGAGNIGQGVVWNVATGKFAFRPPVKSSYNALFSPDNRWLVIADGEAYRLYETGTWKPGLVIARTPGANCPEACRSPRMARSWRSPGRVRRFTS